MEFERLRVLYSAAKNWSRLFLPICQNRARILLLWTK